MSSLASAFTERGSVDAISSVRVRYTSEFFISKRRI
jgi:hypothetical protein